MDYLQLTKIGLNINEAKIYLALLDLGPSPAGRLIKKTEFHRNIVYDNLEKLIDKGIVTFIIENGKKVFQTASPNMLVEYFNKKESELKKKKEEAIKISNEISKKIRNMPGKQVASIYRGIKGIKSFYNDTLKNKSKEFVVFGAPQSSVDIMGDLFWENYEIKRRKVNLKARLIFNNSIRSYGDKLKNKWTNIRYFDKDFEPLTETHIQGDKVAVIVWSHEPMLFLIEDTLVAKSYMTFFEKMWKLARP